MIEHERADAVSSHEQSAHQHSGNPLLTSAHATIHCLIGCVIGEVTGLLIGVSLGLNVWLTMSLATVLAYVSGFTLGLVPVIRRDQRIAGGRCARRFGSGVF